MIPGIVLLIAQAALAVLMVELLRLRVLPAIGSLRMPALLIDVWLPLALACPMIAAAVTVGPDVSGWGWVATGLPALAAPLGMACVLLLGSSVGALLPGDQPHSGISLRATGWTVGAAIILVMIAAVDVLSSLAGQCVFALAAVLLWINTPEDEEPSEGDGAPRDRADSRAWNAMAIVMLLALVQGMCVAFQSPLFRAAEVSASIAIPPAFPRIAPLAILATQLLLAFLHAGRRLGSATGVRLACWTGVYGSLMALGVMSLAAFLPAALQVISEPTARVPLQIAHGFATYAPEAALLLMAGLVAPFVARAGLPVAARRLLGAGLLLVLLGLVAWRLAGLVSTSLP